jgi:hypothetical protein
VGVQEREALFEWRQGGSGVWTNQGLWLNVEEGLRQEAAAGIRTGSVKVLDQQPGSELPVLLNRGRFGLYMQLVSW